MVSDLAIELMQGYLDQQAPHCAGFGDVETTFPSADKEAAVGGHHNVVRFDAGNQLRDESRERARAISRFAYRSKSVSAAHASPSTNRAKSAMESTD